MKNDSCCLQAPARVEKKVKELEHKFANPRPTTTTSSSRAEPSARASHHALHQDVRARGMGAAAAGGQDLAQSKEVLHQLLRDAAMQAQVPPGNYSNLLSHSPPAQPSVMQEREWEHTS
jgi:predicted HAD superfamily Cof-like phosphohydrolase